MPEVTGATGVEIRLQRLHLNGEMFLPLKPLGMVLFIHGGNGNGQHSNHQHLGRTLQEHGIGALLFDLLSPDEEQGDRFIGQEEYDIGLLAERLQAVTAWARQQHPDQPVGYFGANVGGGVALMAAAQSTEPIRAIVSHSGRLDLPSEVLSEVKAPTLLVVGGRDTPVIEMNKQAYEQMHCLKELRLVPGVSHLYEEVGGQERVAAMATEWFERYLLSEARA